MSKEKKVFQLEKKEICITSSQIKQAIDLLVNENEILREEIERLNNRVVALRETIRLANNNVLKDISMIKTIGMEKQEIIQRLFETSKILEGVDKE